MDDEFGPVCDNPACAEHIQRLEAEVTRLTNDNADAYGRLQTAEENAA